MKGITLIIGSKTSSSWSLRPWLFLKHHGVIFDEIVIPLDLPDTPSRILKHSPSGRVPVLKHGAATVWESLAICEYAAETFGLTQAWPPDPPARALARSVAAEMHAGFADLRKEMPFKPARQPARLPITDRAQADIGRIRQIWRGCRKEHGRGGEWLFGAFGIVDAMYAPVALRFHTYGVALDGPERDYVYAMLAHPAIVQWIDAAVAEPPSVPAVSSIKGRLRERVAERSQKRDLAAEITEPVSPDAAQEIARMLGPTPPAVAPDFQIPEPMPREPEPHRSELVLPSVPIVTLAPARPRPEPTPPTRPGAQSGAAIPDAAGDKNPPDDEAPPPRIKSFILPP